MLLVWSVSCLARAEADLEVKPLTDGVWLHVAGFQTQTWGRVTSNGLIVDEGDHVVVVDTAWGAENSRALLDWIDREIGKPVARLIVGHFHDDRLGGWEVFAERGARVVALKRTVELAGIPSEARDAFDLLALMPGERQTVGSLEVLYPGPAHAEDNIVVWVPQVDMVAGGCAVRSAKSRGMGNTADASIADWADSMRRVQHAYLDAVQVLPGHGDMGGPELLDHTISLAEAALAP